MYGFWAIVAAITPFWIKSQRLLISVHRDHNFAGHVIAVEHAGHFLARLRFETDERIHLVPLFVLLILVAVSKAILGSPWMSTTRVILISGVESASL